MKAIHINNKKDLPSIQNKIFGFLQSGLINQGKLEKACDMPDDKLWLMAKKFLKRYKPVLLSDLELTDTTSFGYYKCSNLSTPTLISLCICIDGFRLYVQLVAAGKPKPVYEQLPQSVTRRQVSPPYEAYGNPGEGCRGFR